MAKLIIHSTYIIYFFSLETLIHSIKANRDCKTLRKEFNLCRANLLGKFVEP
jgi:hypothetical protein